MSEHLELPFIPLILNRPTKQGFGAKRVQRSSEDKQDFYRTSIEKFKEFESSQEEKKKRFPDVYNPNLIFKVVLNNKEDEKSFRDELNKSNIQILSPSPDKSGYWVAFSEEQDLHTFRTRINKYATGVAKYDILNGINSFELIPRADKIGHKLNSIVLQDNEKVYVDVELWRMSNQQIDQFVNGIEEIAKEKGCRLTDKLIKRNFCLLRFHANQDIIDFLLDCNEVSSVELPPKPYLNYSYLQEDIENLPVINELTNDSAAIAVLDSGIVSNHPLFEGAIADELPDLNGVISDDTGHGTKVGGIALYGDIKKCIDEGVFRQKVWIVSAKIMFDDGSGQPKYDSEKLLEHQLQDVVEEIRTNYRNCRVFNLSLGNADNKVFELRKQFNLAVLLDELSKDYDVIFTVSAGNNNTYSIDDYPAYFQENIPDYKIIDPASAALAITVGSIAHIVAPLQRGGMEDLFYAPATENHPSPFTCIGPGFNGMIKPEFVEYGGNIITNRYAPINNIAAKVLSLNRNFATEGKLFSVGIGTSMACPKVANLLATIINKYPDKSNNMIKALLLSSAKVPKERPAKFNGITKNSPDKKLQPLFNVYGFGLPCINEALESGNDKVLLLRENKIGLNRVQLYSIELPSTLFTTRGRRTISVTLVYDPPVNKNRIDYLACKMGFTLFCNVDIETVRNTYQKIQIEEGQELDDIEDKITLPQVKLKPGSTLRNKGVHQKGATYFDKLVWDKEKPLVLAIVCQDKNIGVDEYLQNYAVIVKIEHEGNQELYNQIKLKNQVRLQVRG